MTHAPQHAHPTPAFVMMGDQNYAASMTLCLRAIQQFYPTSRLYVYDWGLTPAQRATLQGLGETIQVLDWQQNIPPKQAWWRYPVSEIVVSQRALWRARLPGTGALSQAALLALSFLKPTALAKQLWFEHIVAILRTEIGHCSLAKQLWFEHIVAEKINCFADVLERNAREHSGATPVVFFDADALLIDQIDELLTTPTDLTVTVRPAHEVSWADNHVKVLNSGVLVFGADHAKRQALVAQWRQRARMFDEYLAEQSSLSRLVAQTGINFQQPPAEPLPLQLGGITCAIRCVPCTTYNYNWIEQLTADHSRIHGVKVLHFKGSRHQLATFQALWQRIRPLLRPELQNITVDIANDAAGATDGNA